jgi:hypothetical protein
MTLIMKPKFELAYLDWSVTSPSVRQFGSNQPNFERGSGGPKI